MAPSSEVTKLDGSDGPTEYIGANKLKDKKVLITGGEYVPYSSPKSPMFHLL
jgi:hypothetical protein